MKNNSKLIFFISLTLFFQNIHSEEISLKNYLININTMEADFEQSNYSNSNALIDKSIGRIKIKKPDNLLWDIELPFSKKIALQKDTLRIFDSQLNQLLISSIPMEIENSFLILLLSNANILNFYSIVKIEKDGDEEQFSLVGNNRRNIFEKIEIYITKDKLSKFIFVSATNESIELELMNVLINKHLPDKDFIINVSDNTEIIDQKND
ncbi:MAG: outer membrane lipoprotein carrier protein LolA [Gammaproteobacteria bacterium]|jgi:outer membrane lipoprotein carrier protein|nr:outer membrane lipoprotein carrier protein LolA [Gammaproteobacteria bacterium]MBT5542130.1 outer membrane lipoprotein carrier protein LolA [Gammaproteobacteria bacterium]